MFLRRNFLQGSRRRFDKDFSSFALLVASPSGVVFEGFLAGGCYIGVAVLELLVYIQLFADVIFVVGDPIATEGEQMWNLKKYARTPHPSEPLVHAPHCENIIACLAPESSVSLGFGCSCACLLWSLLSHE